jgi:hypothetical protein
VLPGSTLSVREGRGPAIAVLARVRICARGMAAAAADEVAGWGGGGCESTGAGRPDGTSPPNDDNDAFPGDIPLWERWSMRGPTGFEGGAGCIFLIAGGLNSLFLELRRGEESLVC